MKSNYVVIYILAFFLTWACTSDESTNGTSNGENGPITHTLDTTIGYGFQLFDNSVAEGFEIVIKGNKIKGEGKRAFLNTQTTYRLIVEGTLDGNTAEVDIHVADVRKTTKSFTHRETWEIGEDFLKVTNRKTERLEGDYKFNRVLCQTQVNKDTTLYNSFGSFSEGGYAVVSKKGKFGILNQNNELTVPLRYRDLGVIREGAVTYFDENVGLYGLLDVTNGALLVEPQYIEIMAFSAGLAAFMTEDGKWGFFNRDLEIAIEPKFLNVNFFKPDPYRNAFNEGLANVETEAGKWNYIDQTGQILIKEDFAYTKGFKNGEAEVYKDGKWFFINKRGECVKNCE
jgi:hypothetical protein